MVTPAELQHERPDGSAASATGPEEHTLTRRELREMRNAAATPAPVDVPTPAANPSGQLPPEQRPSESEELAAAMAEFDRIYQANLATPLVEPPAAVSSAPGTSAPVSSAPVAPPVDSAPVAPAPVPSTPAPVAPPVVERAPTFIPPAPEPPAENTEPAEPLREVISAPEVYAAPAGHWSNQISVNEQAAGTGPHQRNLASIDAITTSALVLPVFPTTGPITGPVNGTGEVLLTGSIDLPRSLGINGLHPSRYDRADIDAIIDAGDREDSAPDSAPVRAVRAVSTYTSSQGIIATKRPRGNNLPMVLSITAGVMMVGVVVLIVAGMIFKIF
ncbi:MAG: hypothetical protein KF801_06530 [Cryobacterium sp.]|nr:hypothetical protein [Cryobacterium sp.]